MSTDILNNTLLKDNTKKALLLQSVLLTSAIALPAVCHLLGFSGRALLPMHYPVLLAGLVYGWRAGLILGLASVCLSNVLTGMPPMAIMPIMLVELGLYGFVAGLCRQGGLGMLVSILTSLAVGKAAYLCLAYFMLSGTSFNTLSAGALSVVVQILIIPVLANLWIKKLQ